MSMINTVKKNKLLILVTLVYIFLFIAMKDKGVQSVKNSMYYVIEMLEIIPVVFLLTSIIETWVPREIIIKSFGEKSGVKGNIFSFLLGSFSAGPIYAAFPVCKMLLGKGASITNIVIILSTWAVIKIPMLANEAKFLGPRFMEIRWILTTISIFAMAHLISIIVKKNDIPNEYAVSTGTKNIPYIKQEYCIGCSLCTKICPENFSMVNGKALIKNASIDENSLLKVNDAVNKCPVKAIFFK